MGKLHDRAKDQNTDEIPISHSRWTTRELERRQQDFIFFKSGDRYFDPEDCEPDTDHTLPVVDKKPK